MILLENKVIKLLRRELIIRNTNIGLLITFCLCSADIYITLYRTSSLLLSAGEEKHLSQATNPLHRVSIKSEGNIQGGHIMGSPGHAGRHLSAPNAAPPHPTRQ